MPGARWCDADVADSEDTPSPMAVNVALCVDAEGLDRLASALRYLAVGLVDQAIQVRLLSSDARIESMTLGPIQTLVHDRIHWAPLGSAACVS